MAFLKKKGFTLLELLVVAAIIGLVASIIIVMLNNAKMKARDAKRYAEVDALKKALELYYDNNDKYPEATDWIKIEEDPGFSAAMQPYVSHIPRDPLYPKTEGEKIFSYQYKSTEDAQGYKLHVEMETGKYFETSYEVYMGEGIELIYTPTPAPIVSSVTPDSGSTAGGIVVTITGTNFVNDPALTVTFGGTPATINSISPTAIEAITPVHAAGAVDVKVTNPDNQSGTRANGYTYIAAIIYVRSGGVTGTSFSFNIGSAGTNRLVTIHVNDETTTDRNVTATVDAKSCTAVVDIVNIVGAGNYQSMLYCDEDNLGTSAGVVTVVVGGCDVGCAVHAHLYTGVVQTGPTDNQIDNTSAGQYEILPAAVDIPANGLIVFGAGNGQDGTSYNNADWDTNPTEGTDDGLSLEIELTEVTDYAGPSPGGPDSAVLATAYWISSTTAQTNRLFRARGSASNNRGTGIVATWDKAGAAPPAPTVSSVTPNSGSTAGGIVVTITGTNFVNDPALTVTFGGTPATINSISPTAIEAITPVHAAGAVDVKVTNPDNQSDILASAYTYIDWWSTDWPNRIKLTFNNSASIENLYDFPVLVSLTSTEIDYTKTKDAGEDIRFIDTDNTTQLKYEIEEWDEAGTSAVWVKVPQIDAVSTTDYIWMYYNNPSATDNQNASGVWDTNYKGVWHLKETSGTQYDSTQYGNNGIPSVTTQGSATGKINGADEFTGTLNYVQVGTSNWGVSQGTVEVWGYPTATTYSRYFFGHTTQPSFNNRIQLFTDDTTGNLDLGLGDSHYRAINIQTLTVNTWYHIVLTWNGTNYIVYVNGILKANGTYTGLSALQTFGDIGNDGDTLTRNEGFNGTIDEVRASGTVRSANWIQAQYKSMNGAFITFGSEESY